MRTGKQAYRDKDYETAFYHYERLSDFGLPAAKMELGKMYMYGRGAPADPQKALTLFEEAGHGSNDKRAERYINQARTKLGVLSLHDKPGGLPAEEGIRLLREAVAQDKNAQALFELGYAYERGRGVPRDGRQADHYYKQAAEAGNPKALYYRAKLYEAGYYVPQNTILARQLYQQAADSGYARGYLNLGRMHEKGIGVTQDYSRALEYYRLAEAHDISAQKDMQRLQKNLD